MTAKMTRRCGFAVVAAAVLAATTRARAAAGEAPGAANVTIDNFTFAPMALTIAAGTKVTFTNRDDMPHLVTSAATPPAFRSPPMDTDDSFAFVFERAGVYDYFCAIHPHMTGRVVVR